MVSYSNLKSGVVQPATGNVKVCGPRWQIHLLDLRTTDLKKQKKVPKYKIWRKYCVESIDLKKSSEPFFWTKTFASYCFEACLCVDGNGRRTKANPRSL